MKARKDALSHAEKSNMEMLFILMRGEVTEDDRHCDNMRVASDDETQLCINMDQQHLSMTRASSRSSKTKLTRCVKYPLVVVPEEQVTTIYGQEIHFQQYFQQILGVLPGLYSLGVDVVDHNDEPTRHVDNIFDTATVDKLWEEEGICTPEIISKFMEATICINEVRKVVSVCVADDTILVLPGVRNVSTLINTNNGITMTFMDWIMSKTQLNFKLGLGSALDDILLLRVPEHDLKKGSLY